MTTPKQKRIGPLDTVGRVAAELGKLYREARRGNIEAQDASRFASILTALRGCLETEQIERRMTDLEQRLKGGSP